MTTRLAQLFFSAAAIFSSAIVAAAPGQKYPGESTQAHVWVENRNRTDAIPVVVEAFAASAPVAVQVTGTPSVQVTGTPTVHARLVRQDWEYRVIAIAAGEDAAAMLTRAGGDGWEATGVQLPTPSGSALLMKRPR